MYGGPPVFLQGVAWHVHLLHYRVVDIWVMTPQMRLLS